MIVSALNAILPVAKFGKKVASVHSAARKAPRKHAKLIAGHSLEMVSILTSAMHLDFFAGATGVLGVGLILHHVLTKEIDSDID